MFSVRFSIVMSLFEDLMFFIYGENVTVWDIVLVARYIVCKTIILYTTSVSQLTTTSYT